MQKKIPQRQCIACRNHFDKKSLGRVVKTPQGDIVFDKTGKVNGRGAYVCINENCIKRALKSNAFQRALECQIPDNIIEIIQKEIEDNNAR